MQHATVLPVAEADYLSGELASAVRHEYVAGHIYAMAGAGKAHNLIAGNLFSHLRAHLRGKPCRGFIADMKVHVSAAQAYFYPDVVVTCSPRDLAADAPNDYLTEPVLIVEVLSASTEAIDRREKMRAYATLASLQEYVLVDSRSARLEIYRRLPAGGWDQWIPSPGEPVRLDSVALSLDFADIYEDVVL